MLPEFLFADNSLFSTELVYIVHTQQPRFILQCNGEDFMEDQEIFWLDPEPGDEDEKETLICRAEDFYEAVLDNEEELDEE